MKVRKVLVAALAGTMVFAMTAPVFAADPIRVTPAYDCWWWKADTDDDEVEDYDLTEEEIASKIAITGTITGDGTWTIVMKCIATDRGPDQEYTITGDVFDDSDRWISWGTHGDMWGNCTPSGINPMGPCLTADSILTFTIIRTGPKYKVYVCKDGIPFLNFKTADAELEGDTLNTRIIVQYGVVDVYPIIKGDANAAINAVKDSLDSTGSTDSTGSAGSTGFISLAGLTDSTGGISKAVEWETNNKKAATLKNGKTTAVGKNPTLTIKKGGKKFTKSNLTVGKKKKKVLEVTANLKDSRISITKLTAKQKKIASVTLKKGKLTVTGKKKGSFTLKINSGKNIKKIKIVVK